MSDDKKPIDDNVAEPTIATGFTELIAAPIPEGTIDPVYEAKARILNTAIQDIGMGWYQWQLFVVVGFGWASDNLWPIVTSLLLVPIDFEFNPHHIQLLSLAQNIGLLAGAVFWGFGCDVFGRRWAFNLTLGVTSVFGIISSSAPNFVAIGIFDALWSFGVGGNLPVDSAVFLEFLPGSHQYLLTVLSIDWAFAQLLATGIAWPLIGYHTCSSFDCTRSENFGWRYFVITMGCIAMLMFFIRFVCFTIYESPKYLMGKGRDEEAVRVVHEVARRNGTTSNLTVESLKACEALGTGEQRVDATAAIKRNLQKLNLTHVRSLFATAKLAMSTGLIMVVWAFIGLAFPLYNSFLPFILEQRGKVYGDGSVNLTYRNSLIIASLGVPGAIIGGAMVEIPKFGRKGTLALSTILTGVFLFGTTTSTTSNALLGWNCAWNFMSNVMFAVLYAYTPEVFPTKDRGTGNALAASANRIFGIMAPIVSIYANINTAAPVYVSGALFIAAGVIVVILPFEPQGKASL